MLEVDTGGTSELRMTATGRGHGYGLVAKDNGIFAFGPGAGFHRATGNVQLNQPIVVAAGQ
jgi:hypothetical protein